MSAVDIGRGAEPHSLEALRQLQGQHGRGRGGGRGALGPMTIGAEGRRWG